MELVEKEETQLPLTRLFPCSSAKVLDFLLTNEGISYTEEEISELAAVSERTLQRSLQTLLVEKIIKREKRNKRTYHYTANLSSPRVSGLSSYINSTMMDNLDAVLQKG